MAKFLVKTSSESGIQGPFSGQELEQLARTAELQPQYLVSEDAGTSWQDAIRFFSNDLEPDIEPDIDLDIEPEPNERATPASEVSTNIDHDFDACEALLQSGAGRFGWIKENADRGLAAWREAAETDDARGQVLCGCCYFYGCGVEQDGETAVEWFRKSAEQGNAQGQFSLGQCYYHGDGVAENDEAAVEWFLKAAEQGNSFAQSNLGRCCLHGHGVEQNEPKAVEWFQQAAAVGNSQAECCLGDCYFGGTGVKEDERAAVEWFRKSAEQGDPDGQRNLAQCLQSATGVEQDNREAVEWFRKAAEQDDAEACLDLAQCYATGNGVQRDTATAREWAQKSTDNGNEYASEWLENYERFALLTVDLAEQLHANWASDDEYDEENEDDPDDETEEEGTRTVSWYELNEFRRIEDEAAEVLLKCRTELDLSGLETISLEAITTLNTKKAWKGNEGSWRTFELNLSGLREISPEVAEELASRFAKKPDYMEAALALNGLRTVDPDVAVALTKHNGALELNGLVHLSDEFAQALTSHQHRLEVGGITELSDTAAECLGLHKGDSLVLNGLTELSDNAAKHLGLHKGDQLNLNGITQLSDKAAEYLGLWAGSYLELEGLQQLSAEAADRLLGRPDDDNYRCVTLSGLKTVTEPVAERLVEHFGDGIDLSQLENLSPEVARRLAVSEGELWLGGLTSLSVDAAEHLAGNKAGLYLDGLTELTEEVAQILSGFTGSLSLQGLTSLSDSAARHLGNLKGNIQIEMENLPPSARSILGGHPSMFEMDDGSPAPIPDQLVSGLNELGISSIVGAYEASNDDGEMTIEIQGDGQTLVESDYYYHDDLAEKLFESIGPDATLAPRPTVTLEECKQVCDSATSLMWKALPAGFEQGSGSSGSVEIDVEDGYVQLDHGWNH